MSPWHFGQAFSLHITVLPPLQEQPCAVNYAGLISGKTGVREARGLLFMGNESGHEL